MRLRYLGLASAMLLIACGSPTDASLPPWPTDGRTPALGVYEAALRWEAAGSVFPAGSTHHRFRVLPGPADTLRAVYFSGPFAGDTIRVWPEQGRPGRYWLPVSIDVAGTFLVAIERPDGAERLACSGGIPMSASVGYLEHPLDCAVRLVAP